MVIINITPSKIIVSKANIPNLSVLPCLEVTVGGGGGGRC